jgi:precorrin-6B methylase 1
MTTPWLTFIGIGEDGREGLSPLAQRLIDQAPFVMGGVRHLSLIGRLKTESKKSLRGGAKTRSSSRRAIRFFMALAQHCRIISPRAR